MLVMTRACRATSLSQPRASASSRSAGSDAGATLTSYYTAGGTGTCGNRPGWADLVCSNGPGGAPCRQAVTTFDGEEPVKVPRRIACLVMIPKNSSTRLSQNPEVGVKCSVTRG